MDGFGNREYRSLGGGNGGVGGKNYSSSEEYGRINNR